MKNRNSKKYFFFLLIAGAMLLSCNKEGSEIEIAPVELDQAKTLVDAEKVTQIKNTTNKKRIAYNQLPELSKETIKDRYASSSVNSIYRAEDYGFEVLLYHETKRETNRTLIPIYFNQKGILLVSDESELEELEADPEATESYASVCFEYTYPMNFSLSDGNTLTVATEADWEMFDQWLNDNPNDFPEVVFPINILFYDGTKGVIPNIEAEESLLEECVKELFVEGDIGNLPTPEDHVFPAHEKILQSCFNYDYVYPITFDLPGGKQLLLEDTSDWIALDEWYENNAETETFPEIVYPFSVLSQDGETIVLDSQEEGERFLELNALKCYLLFTFEQRLSCYDYVYPLSIVLPNQEIYNVQNREELLEKGTILINEIKTVEADKAYSIFPVLDYPVKIILSDDSNISVTSAEDEMAVILDRCFDIVETEEGGTIEAY